jgi:hypothetical protein
MHTKNTEYIEIHLDSVIDYYRKCVINFVHVDGKTNHVDMFTKAVTKTQFESCCRVIGMRPVIESMG